MAEEKAKEVEFWRVWDWDKKVWVPLSQSRLSAPQEKGKLS